MGQGLWFAPLFALVALAAVVFVSAMLNSGPAAFRRGIVTGVVGRMGSGKTLFVMHRCYKHLKAGGQLTANFSLTPTPEMVRKGARIGRFTSWAELAREPSGTLVVLDEAHLFAPSTQGFRLPDEARWYLSMCRKLGHEVMWCCQHESRVSTQLRAQTHEMVICKPVGFGWHRAKYYDPDEFRKASARMWYGRWYRRAKPVISLYDTFELILAEASADKAGTVAALVEHQRSQGAERSEAPAIATSPQLLDPDEWIRDQLGTVRHDVS